MLQPRVVLAPIDFSDAAHESTEIAADMASRFGAALLLAHVVPALPKLPHDITVIFKEGEYERHLHDEALRRVAALSAKYAQTGLAVTSDVGIANDVGMEILRIAEREKADLIVIATHGMSGWRSLAFGSVAEKVVRMAQCPVLLLRAPRRAQQ